MSDLNAQEAREFLGLQSAQAFDSVSINIASPDTIRGWSRGEVKNPETINYRTFKPEPGGLFCQKIFGPVRDYECACGKYKRIKFKGVVCDRCGVEVTISRVRRERMGHIELAVPVAHIWFLKSLPSRLGLLLDMTAKSLERVVYYENYIVTNPGKTQLEFKQLLTEQEYQQAIEEYGDDAFQAHMGAGALRDILSTIDLKEEAVKVQDELRSTRSKQIKKKLSKRLKILQGFITSGAKPGWMVQEVIPVIPPDLRPLVPLEGGRFATSDLNDLYRRVINRNNRLRNLLQLKTPDVIIHNEKRMLQEAVDALYDNGRHGRAVTGAGNRPLKSLSEMLKGTPETDVIIEVSRPGIEKHITKKLLRQHITIPNVPYYAIIKDSIGYIRLTNFTTDAGKDVREAFTELKKQKAKAVILDLRNNPGGLLNEAVGVVSCFVSKSQLVVFTKGKVKDSFKKYYTFSEPVDTTMPLAVLVSRGSASASEIVAGSLQDLDRAVIIGQRTYGKGLVQQTRPLSYNTQLKVTTAKYYIPSGRCIQALDYTHRNEDGSVGIIEGNPLGGANHRRAIAKRREGFARDPVEIAGARIGAEQGHACTIGVLRQRLRAEDVVAVRLLDHLQGIGVRRDGQAERYGTHSDRKRDGSAGALGRGARRLVR